MRQSGKVISALRRPWLFPALALTFMLVGCGRSPVRPDRPAPTTVVVPAGTSAIDASNAVLFRAMSLVGTPYHWGGNTPVSGFDCSGLVAYIFRDAAAVKLPRQSSAMGAIGGRQLSRRQLQSGDLVFFAASRSISHVGVYVGEQRFVHAPNSGGTVRLDSLDGAWWKDHFVYGKRVFE